jgi:hypothetical protein
MLPLSGNQTRRPIARGTARTLTTGNYALQKPAIGTRNLHGDFFNEIGVVRFARHAGSGMTGTMPGD